MARVIVPQVTEAAPEGENIRIGFTAIFYGSDMLQGPTPYGTSFLIAPGDSAATINTNWNNAILSIATQIGVTVAANQIIRPSYTRG